MGILTKLTKALGLAKDMNIEDFMTASEAEEVDVLHQAADFYVKPIGLQTDSDIKAVEDELNQRNLILLNITPIARNPVKLKSAVNELRSFVHKINGDIARIDEDKILLTPANVKIVKRKKLG
ncbi:MAG: cell division protein SepF [Candidatus Micrarchaeota archaeon]|nr:cell division protein SepF [Candidatus Micrarchaeota archaeon]